MNRNIINQLKVSAIIAGIVVIIIFGLSQKFFLARFVDFSENTFLDWMIHKKIASSSTAPKVFENIVIVDIDQITVDKFDQYNHIPRQIHARVIDFLAAAKSRIIVLGILFFETDTTEVANDLLISSIFEARNVILAVPFVNAQPNSFIYKMYVPPKQFYAENFSFNLDSNVTKIFPAADCIYGNFFDLYNNARNIGFINYFPDQDGAIRRTPLFINFAGRQNPVIALAAFCDIHNIDQKNIHIDPGKAICIDSDGKSLQIPVDSNNQMLINYYGQSHTFQYVSFYDIVQKRISPQFFENKIIFIGSSAGQYRDLRKTPVQHKFPGIEIHATILQNLMENNFIGFFPQTAMYPIFFILVIIVVFVTLQFRSYLGILSAILLLLISVYSTCLIFNRTQQLINPLLPITALMLGSVSAFIYQKKQQINQKKKLGHIFKGAISDSMLTAISIEKQFSALAQIPKTGTVLHAELDDFTALSEHKKASEVIEFLDQFNTLILKNILRTNGYLYSNHGDKIMAFWGIPLTNEDYANQACYSALHMLAEFQQFGEKWMKKGWPAQRLVIGITTATFLTGQIGTSSQLRYIVSGAGIELSNRLKLANKMYGSHIIICQETFKQVHDKLWVREMDFIRFRKKTDPIRIYELLGFKSSNIDPGRISGLEYFVQGLELYRHARWTQAYDMFRKALQLNPDDGPSKEFMRRCKIFIERPRSDEWDGVFDLRKT